MTLLITGASGWLGSTVLAQAAGESVVALVATETEARAAAREAPDATVRVADLRDPHAVARAVRDVPVRAVVHAAGVIHPQAVADWADVNVNGLAAVLDALDLDHLAAFVHVSSNSALGVNADAVDLFRDDEPLRPWLGYGRSKAAAERLLQRRLGDRRTTVTVLRPPWFYGPRQPARQARFVRAVRSGRFPFVLPGTQRRSMVYVPELATAALRAARRDDGVWRTWWFSDPRPYPLVEVLQTVRAAARLEGLPVTGRLVPIPAAAARLAEAVDGALQRRGRYSAEMHVLGELGRSIAGDPAAGRRALLGDAPGGSLLTHWRASIRWAIDQGQEV